MIYATLATYPPRLGNLPALIAAISPQVDCLRIVLNEFTEVPDECKGIANVETHIPSSDIKDTGKFLFEVGYDDWLFTVDDDIFYPKDYVAISIAMLEATNVPHAIGGYHASIYRRHKYLNSRFLRRVLGRDPNFIVGSRKIYGFSFRMEQAMFVDQLGTGVALMRGKDAPPFEAIRHGQRFVDIAAASWWLDNKRQLVCLPRPENWIVEREPVGETIIGTFTSRNPKNVADEVYSFAFRNKNVGKLIDGCTVAQFHTT